MATVKEIKATARARAGKGAARAVRRAGRVPGVIYGDNQPPLNISLDHADLRQRIEGMLEALWVMGALSGNSSTQAFTVRCDRSTMTEADLENGRLIVAVSFTASAPIERLTITLAMDESGQVSLLGSAGGAP